MLGILNPRILIKEHKWISGKRHVRLTTQRGCRPDRDGKNIKEYTWSKGVPKEQATDGYETHVLGK